MHRKLILFVIALATFAAAQTPGQLTPSVAEKADAKQTYALYLPSNYTATQHWPVLYLFDPGARGAVAAEHFKAAAEKLGYIVAASNVSKNGPAEPSLNALQAMSVDVESRFSVNTKRRYIAGFSGGARAAVIAGIEFSGAFAGVLGFGAGLPAVSGASSITGMPRTVNINGYFAYLAGVGESDFNYDEVTRLPVILSQAKSTYRILTYEGTHDWPNPQAALEALEWMDFQARKDGTLAKPSTFPNAEWDTRLSEAKKLATTDLANAERAYSSMVRDFEGLHDLTEPSSELARIRASKDFKKALKAERQIGYMASANARDFDGYFQSMLAAQGAGDKQAPRASAVQLVTRMREDAKSKDRERSLVAQRTLSSSYVTLLQTREQLKPEQTESAIDLADLATIVYPDAWENWYWLGLSHLKAGHRKQALSSFKKSVELGAPKTKLAQDARLETLAKEPEFKAMITE